MRLHVLGLPHTRTVSALSHCAYTGKVRRFAAMMAPLGYECLHYGVGAPDSPGWCGHVEVLSPADQEALLGYDPLQSSAEFVGRGVDIHAPVYLAFNARLRALLRDHLDPEDLICAPFGWGHAAALDGVMHQVVETGIGYYDCIGPNRIYESYAWLHWHLGRDRRSAWLNEYVIPNYLDPAEWPLRPRPPATSDYVLYLGRLQDDKGLPTVVRLAEARPDLTFVICGQGNPLPYLTQPNIEYRPPVHGMARADLLHGARVLLTPSSYVEPFGGVAVEAMITGTPVLSSHVGGFTETVPDGWRCRTLGDWLRGLDATLAADPGELRAYTVARYSLAAIAPQYDQVFRQVRGIVAAGFETSA